MSHLFSFLPIPRDYLTQTDLYLAIKNKIYWVLDVTFNEDRSRTRQKNAPMNMAMIRHVALNLLRRLPKTGDSLKGFRKKAGWDDQLLAEMVNL